MQEYTCQTCSKTFLDYKYKKCKFCSQECHFNSHRRIAKCPVCGKEKILELKKPQKDFCSLVCWGIAHRRATTSKCDSCGKEYTRCISQIRKHKNQKNVFCSPSCYFKFKKLPIEEFKRRRALGVKRYRKANPDKTAMWKQNRRSREINAEGSFTEKEWKDLKDKFNNKCAGCGLEKKLTVDHIKPLSNGGSNYITNIQPLCLICNSTKSVKT